MLRVARGTSAPVPPLPALCIVSSAVEVVGILGELCLASRLHGDWACKLFVSPNLFARSWLVSVSGEGANMEDTSDERLVGAKDGDYIYECTVCHTHTHKHTHRPTNSLHED